MSWFKDWFGKEYLEVYAHRSESQAEAEIAFIEKLSGLTPEDLILDIACGAGRHSAVLKRKGYNVIAADLSPELLIELRNQYKDLHLPIVQHDMRSLPFRDGSFNVVLSLFTSFGYFETDKEQLGVLKQVQRVLKEGGAFVLDYLNKSEVITNLKAESRREVSGSDVHEKRCFNQETQRIEKEILITKDKQTKVFKESVRAYDLDELKSLFNEAGLRIESVYGDFAGGEYSETSRRTIICAGRA